MDKGGGTKRERKRIGEVNKERMKVKEHKRVKRKLFRNRKSVKKKVKKNKTRRVKYDRCFVEEIESTVKKKKIDKKK